MMNFASGVRKRERVVAWSVVVEGERESIPGRKAERKRRPGEEVVGERVERAPVWMVVLPVAIVVCGVFEVHWVVM
jgi:hypothetical protein